MTHERENSTLILTVEVKSGKQYKWEFTDLPADKSDYGTGKYIHVKYPSGDESLIDARYTHDAFFEIVTEYIHQYYGSNLKSIIIGGQTT